MPERLFSPKVPFLLLRVLLYAALVIPRVTIRRFLFIPILLLSIFVTLYTTTGTGLGDFGIGTSLGVSLFFASDYLLLCSDVQEDIRFEGQKEGMRSRPLMERMVWALRMNLNLRVIGTNVEPTSHVPPRPSITESRKTYILKQLAWLALYLPLRFATVEFNKWNPRFSREASVLSVARDEFPWWWRITILSSLVEVYLGMSTTYSVMSILSVGLNLSKPHDWPPPFASPLEAYTLRRYWGRMWHQFYRRFLTTHANYAAHLLRLPRRSKITTYFKLFFSFFISGFIHLLGDYMDTHTLFGGAITYFMLHACVITLEDMVIAVGKRMGLRESWRWRLVGYAWVVFIFTMLLPEWTDARLAILSKS
ncbi:hypothetical protein M413DRAFT_442221 [Hebeloma cylindrosporum]|uniref:Wax synthase domain-containing protein n=1 Tax=Hebeloma cylindrosporum TaxID=76867 RepID=A0A0C2YX32_HEBCY|nr:hypothetical protein M413DRAFT_442221 [Hebeloma cylindrosporum h7]